MFYNSYSIKCYNLGTNIRQKTENFLTEFRHKANLPMFSNIMIKSLKVLTTAVGQEKEGKCIKIGKDSTPWQNFSMYDVKIYFLNFLVVFCFHGSYFCCIKALKFDILTSVFVFFSPKFFPFQVELSLNTSRSVPQSESSLLS